MVLHGKNDAFEARRSQVTHPLIGIDDAGRVEALRVLCAMTTLSVVKGIDAEMNEGAESVVLPLPLLRRWPN